VLTVLELCTRSAAQADAANVARHFSKIQGFDTAAVEVSSCHGTLGGDSLASCLQQTLLQTPCDPPHSAQAAQQRLVRVLEDVMHGRTEMLPPDVPPELLHVIAAAAAPQHLQARVHLSCTTWAVCTWGTPQIS
jgi:hypothetical protein